MAIRISEAVQRLPRRVLEQFDSEFDRGIGGEAMKYTPIPPVPPRAVPLEDVPRIDAMKALGITQVAIARHINAHPRTVSNIVLRKGAYAGVPK